MLKLSSLVLAVVFSVGCAPQHDPAPPPPMKTVFDPLTQNLGKARGVQQAADANADATHQAVDSQERGDSAP